MSAKKNEPQILTQSAFIAEVAKTQKTTQIAVSNAIKLLKLGAMDVLRQRKSFRLFEFISFNIAEVKERTGKNPATGDNLIIPAHDVLRVKPSKTLKNMVKGDVKVQTEAKKPKAKPTKKKAK